MSSTRIAAAGTNPDEANERYLSSNKLRGLQVGMHIIARVGRVRTERERHAMFWIFNYTRIHNLTSERVCAELGITKIQLRLALTNPNVDIGVFVEAAEKCRAQFEKILRRIARTSIVAEVHEAIAFGFKAHRPVEIIGRNRIGKTDAAWESFLFNMHRAVYFICPHDSTERSFVWEFAKALGISVNSGRKLNQVIPQIRACFGRNALEGIYVDEGHFILPEDTKNKPTRLEFLRSLWDMHRPPAMAIFIIATPQFSLSMSRYLDKAVLWAPGQWDGRVVRFHLDDTLGDRDLYQVAKWHASDFSDEMLRLLVLQAKATEGFCGLMVNTIELARFKSEGRNVKVNREILLQAVEQMAKKTKIEELIQAQSSSKRLKKAA